jgi:M6 family metalloprotease-like protein
MMRKYYFTSLVPFILELLTTFNIPKTKSIAQQQQLHNYRQATATAATNKIIIIIMKLCNYHRQSSSSTIFSLATSTVVLMMATTNNNGGNNDNNNNLGIVTGGVYGMPANPVSLGKEANTFHEIQPDGTVIKLQLHGDPYSDTWMSDIEQYTVVRDPITHQFVYAEDDSNGGLRPSSEQVMVNELDSNNNNNDHHENDYHPQQQQQQPSMSSTTASESSSSPSSVRKQKRLRPTQRDCRNKLCGEHDHENRQRGLRGGNNDNDDDMATRQQRTLQAAASRGSLRNLVLLIKWSDHNDRILPTREEYEILMNNNGPYSSKLAPTGSVRDVFLQNSYGQLNVDSYVTDWIPMDNTEDYYANGDKGMTTKIQDAIRYALKYVDNGGSNNNNDDSNNNIDFDFFDEDHDGYIDSITFIHSGYPAEAGGSDAYGRFYEDRIWSHKWSLYEGPFRSENGRGTRVSAYQISSGLWGVSGSDIGRIGVISHEMAHFLGLPDLYDYDASSVGAGNYGLMANSWGSDGEQTSPPYMSAWAKLIMGWVTPVEATPGLNIIEAAAIQDPFHPQVYIIKDGFPEGEFLLIENRQPLGFDRLLPQGGLAIWHIDYGTNGQYSQYNIFQSQSTEGHPLQEGWPENGNHYAVALLQADGYYDLEMGFNLGDYEDLFHADDVDELIPCKNRNDCQYPNTDSYQGGKILQTNVHITDISISGNIMSFNYAVGEFGSVPTNAPSSTPTNNPTSSPTISPTVSPTTEEERKGRKEDRFCHSDRQCTSGLCEKKKRRFFGEGNKIFGKCALKTN